MFCLILDLDGGDEGECSWDIKDLISHMGNFSAGKKDYDCKILFKISVSFQRVR